ncbi:hypothetical protein WBP06_11045 [Novosphingobium sp. BL-8H]|uniref:hypothetical protein n=1 Tax=Novosphingobium sp. BL-8H TaxID=3127640 RepID=UPI0037576AC7
MAEFESLDNEDDWDEGFAEDLVGCTLLAGLTYVDYDDALIRRRQVFGKVETVDRDDGIVLRCFSSNESVVLAPILNAIHPAEAGIYQLSDADEAVENPDFTILLTVRSPARN